MAIVTFWHKGQTTAFSHEKQVPAMQTSWIVLFFEHLERNGIEPRDHSFQTGDGERFTPVKNDDGSWNYQVSQSAKF